MENPYLAPNSDVETGRAAPDPAVFSYAGFWIRFSVTCLDFVLLGVLKGAIFLALSVAMVSVYGRDPSQEEKELLGFVLMAALLLVSWLYFAGLEAFTGGTLGKLMVGIHVVRKNGAPIGLGRATLRYFGKYLSSILAVGYIMVGFHSEKQGLHDLLADTLVVFRR